MGGSARSQSREYRGDDLTEYFFGLNHFFYGHKLKWQNGLQYTQLDEADGSKEYEGWDSLPPFGLAGKIPRNL